MLRQNFSNDYSSMEDYKEAYNAKDYLLMGRASEISPRRDTHKYPQYVGRILNPEARGDTWSPHANKAFWAGGIDSGKTFKIISSLDGILKRAKDVLNHSKSDIGGAVREILWLEDNGYTFEADKTDRNHTWAIPPKEPAVKGQAIIQEYGFYADDDDLDEQVARIEKIAIDVNQQRNKSLYDSRPRDSFVSFNQGYYSNSSRYPTFYNNYSRYSSDSRSDASNWRKPGDSGPSSFPSSSPSYTPSRSDASNWRKQPVENNNRDTAKTLTSSSSKSADDLQLTPNTPYKKK